MDHILTCFLGTHRELQGFLEYLNKLTSNIKFTLEVENSETINFLDLTFTRKDRNHSFAVYKKPMTTDLTIHCNLFHHNKHKLAAFYALINRLHRVSQDDENYNKELETHGKQHLLNYLKDAQAPKSFEKWCVLPYLGTLT